MTDNRTEDDLDTQATEICESTAMVYNQLGQEIRHFGKMLHQSYYLVVTITVLLIGFWDRIPTQILALTGGIAFTATGWVLFRHRVKQRSATVLRRKIEESISESNEPTDVFTPSIQKGIYAKIFRFSDMPELVERDNIDELKSTRPLLSTNNLAKLLILFGVLMFGYGIYVLTVPEVVSL